MSTFFGSNPTLDHYHFSGVNSYNQESTNASFSIAAPGRVIDLNAYFEGDGETTAARLGMWKASDNSLELNTGQFTAGAGTESPNGQALQTQTVDYFFNTTHSVDVGFWRDKAKSSVVSVQAAGTDGQTKLNVTSITSMSSAVSFTSAYGAGGAMRAYGHYIASGIFVRRAGAWVKVSVWVRRTGAWTQVKVYVRRAGAWTLLNMIPSDGWDHAKEKDAILVYPNGQWERALIIDEEVVHFGNYDPRDEPQSKRIVEVKTKIIKPVLV